MPETLTVGKILLPISDGSACHTNALAELVPVGVFAGEAMPSLTMGLPRVDSRRGVAPVEVVGTRDLFEMIRANAGSIFAEMIDLSAREDRPEVNVVREPMRKDMHPVDCGVAVSGMVSLADPIPAPVRTDINLGPELPKRVHWLTHTQKCTPTQVLI